MIAATKFPKEKGLSCNLNQVSLGTHGSPNSLKNTHFLQLCMFIIFSYDDWEVSNYKVVNLN
jgi:hypothetical protein